MERWMAGTGLVACILLAVPASSYAQDPTWKAGVARAEITPSERLWMAGYASRTHEADDVLLPLFVKAFALQDTAGHKAVIVTSDTLGLPKAMADRIRVRLKEVLGLERDEVILSGSHTHSGPVLRDSLYFIYPFGDAQIQAVERYSQQFEDRVVSCVGEALGTMVSVRLEAGNGVVRFAINRRNNKEAEVLDTHDFKGPVDHAVPVLRAVREDGTPLAVLFGYACHGTVLDLYRWSGDYPGFAQAALEAAHPGMTALFFAGCGADQNPLPRRTVALARQYGHELAAAVDRVFEDPMTPLEAKLERQLAEVELGLMPPPSRETLVAQAQSSTAWEARAAKSFLADLDAGRPLPSTYRYPIYLWRLGSQILVALSGEPVIDYTIAIKQALGRDVFVMGYCNDVMSYIPSVRVLREGGYEGATAQMAYGIPSVWKEDIESLILGAVRDLASIK